MGQLSDRDEQIKRLAAALQEHTPDWAFVANHLYRLGARIPDPPTPTVPVLTPENVEQCLEEIRRDSSSVQALHSWVPGVAAVRERAFRGMVARAIRDTVNALPRELYSGWESIYFPRTDGSQPRWWFPLAAMPDFIRTLTGGAP